LENLCATCSTSTEVEKLNKMLGQYIFDKGWFNKKNDFGFFLSQVFYRFPFKGKHINSCCNTNK
jgi:hypothetical protein